AVEVERGQLGEVLRHPLQRAQHLGRRDAPGERRSQEGAGGEADIDVEVGRLAIDQEVVEGLEAAQLLGSARDRPAREHEGDARIALPRCQVTLVDDREAHGTLTPTEALQGHRWRGVASFFGRCPAMPVPWPPPQALPVPSPSYISVTTRKIVESTETCALRDCLVVPTLRHQFVRECRSE